MVRGTLSLGLLLGLAVVSEVAAVDVKRYDGVHRIEKAQITARAILDLRDGMTAGVCGTSSKLCPASLDGGCCPDDYDCARESCYATTRGESLLTFSLLLTGGCCPDGYLCQTAGNCVPPSGSPYTLGCPASQYLCPSSLSYGCCPNGMGCAVNQCYSTVPVTKTSEMVITTTQSGKTSTYTTRSLSVSTPVAPTRLGNGDGDSDAVMKYFPSALAKATPSAEASSSDNSGGGGGLTKAQLAGIVTGAVAFLVLVIVIAFIVIRHLNKVVAAVASSKSGGSQPQMRQRKNAQFEVDSLMMPPTTKAASDIASSTGQTPTSFAGHYQPVSTVPSVSASTPDIGAGAGYFDINPHHGGGVQVPRRTSQQSTGYSIAPDRPSNDSYGGYTHVRSFSDASDGSDGGVGQQQQQHQGVPQPFSPGLVTELDSRAVVPELPGSPGSSTFAGDDQRRSSVVSSISSIVSRSQSHHHHQRMRSATGGTAKGIETGGLDNINEESSTSGSPNNTLGPQQRKPSWAQGDDYYPPPHR
ncbi:unnamed protein product [Clonostachys rosea f. rosea IK726]|uniref:Uncharacterized protein n=1 Tax=Clonostachys rosea f. rosea IK726 TaxID=1349383 RepID=A0ACA9TCG8_BIOOC|nr:unnamed protein product [Clonostachys rosea f. rosea IK726]